MAKVTKFEARDCRKCIHCYDVVEGLSFRCHLDDGSAYAKEPAPWELARVGACVSYSANPADAKAGAR